MRACDSQRSRPAWVWKMVGRSRNERSTARRPTRHVVVGHVGVLGPDVGDVGVVAVLVGAEDRQVGVAEHRTGAVGGQRAVGRGEADEPADRSEGGERGARGRTAPRSASTADAPSFDAARRPWVVDGVVEPAGEDRDGPVVAGAVESEHDVDDAATRDRSRGGGGRARRGGRRGRRTRRSGRPGGRPTASSAASQRSSGSCTPGVWQRDRDRRRVARWQTGDAVRRDRRTVRPVRLRRRRLLGPRPVDQPALARRR